MSSVRQGLVANKSALVAADAAKMANKRVDTPDACSAGQGKDVAQPSALGRPKDKPFAGTATEQVAAQGGEGRPYDYERMVALAWWYADDAEAGKVPYVRDENDCTNFISWVL